MIVFDLACRAGHVFEAWFGSHADYDDQQARGLVGCPVCGDAMVGKAPMAPRIASGAARKPVVPAEAAVPPIAAAAPAATGEDRARLMQAGVVAQRQMLARSEDVGTDFASEARAIHDGEAEQRMIHGQASLAEARALIEDGVAVAPLPFPVRDPARDH